MPSTTIQARFGEDIYPIGRFILNQGRALGISRTELVRRLGYRQIDSGHRGLAETLTTGTVPPQITKNLAAALQVEEKLVSSLIEATALQQRDEAGRLTLDRESAYRAAFKPHLRSETERVVPEPIFVAAIATTARLRVVPVCPDVWEADIEDRDRLLKRAIQDHYRDHGGWVPAFGTIVGYTAVLMPGYQVDFGVRYNVTGNAIGPMSPLERLGEAGLGIKRGDSRLGALLRHTQIQIDHVRG